MTRPEQQNKLIHPAIPGHSLLNRWNKGERSACERLNKGVVIPEWNPSFQIAPDAKVFAIGSCFARNIEIELQKLGVHVTSANPFSDVMEVRTNLQLGLLNKYNPISIHQELAWAAGESSFPNNGFIDCNGKLSDPFLREQTPGGDLEKMKARRTALEDYFAQIYQADLVIITLGLTETWFDRLTKLAITEAPSPRLMKLYPQRFGFKQLYHPDCIKVLQSICALLKKYGKPNHKIILTVSPVALKRTFSGQDVVVANMMSKSTLRSAAGEIAAHIEEIDYFPSYEAVMMSDPLLVWQEDLRNVTEFIVNQIMNEFVQRYGLKAPQTKEQIQSNYHFLLQRRLALSKKNVNLLGNILSEHSQQNPSLDFHKFGT